MTIEKASFVSSFVPANRRNYAAFLVYGSDEGGVRTIAKDLVSKFCDLNDPFRISILSDSDFKADPARLNDEYSSIAFGGAEKVIWVRDSGDSFFKALGLLEIGCSENVIVAEAGPLSKASKLRRFFEGSEICVCVPVYKDSASDLNLLIRNSLAGADLEISDEATALLRSVLGLDRGVSKSELDKLILFCHGAEEIKFEDILAVCGDFSTFGLDEFIDFLFIGQIENADRCFERLVSEGVVPFVFVNGILRHLFLLQSLRVDLDKGFSIDSSLKSYRPPLYFMRHKMISTHLRIWKEDGLVKLDNLVRKCLVQIRQNSSVERVSVHRLCLAIGHLAGSLAR